MPADRPPEFRERAVVLARPDDEPTGNLAKELDIRSCLQNWIRQTDPSCGR
ncbi:hypothetical protein [Actinocorallia populi]|uniref:hypothetical protein n=1 Tax=Actinocorallia populi TaxID=2079200 RepID=UPI0013004474|nr:hypothetical protein [Actinocorallia populi]